LTLLNPKPYRVLRYSRELNGGVISESFSDDFVVRGNLQPMGDRELANAPEGFRRRPGRKWKFYTAPAIDLRTGGANLDGEDVEPDRLVYSDRLLYVHGVDEWDQGLIPHRKWFLIEPEQEIEATDPDA